MYKKLQKIGWDDEKNFDNNIFSFTPFALTFINLQILTLNLILYLIFSFLEFKSIKFIFFLNFKKLSIGSNSKKSTHS